MLILSRSPWRQKGLKSFHYVYAHCFVLSLSSSLYISSHVVVYNLGAHTLTLSLLLVAGGMYSQLATKTVRGGVGGNEFDKAITDFLTSEFEKLKPKKVFRTNFTSRFLNPKFLGSGRSVSVVTRNVVSSCWQLLSQRNMPCLESRPQRSTWNRSTTGWTSPTPYPGFTHDITITSFNPINSLDITCFTTETFAFRDYNIIPYKILEVQQNIYTFAKMLLSTPVHHSSAYFKT